MCEAGCHLYFRMEAKASLLEDELQSCQGAGAFPELLVRNFSFPIPFFWNDWILHFSKESSTLPFYSLRKAWGLSVLGAVPWGSDICISCCVHWKIALSASPAFCNATPQGHSLPGDKSDVKSPTFTTSQRDSVHCICLSQCNYSIKKTKYVYSCVPVSISYKLILSFSCLHHDSI